MLFFGSGCNVMVMTDGRKGVNAPDDGKDIRKARGRGLTRPRLTR